MHLRQVSRPLNWLLRFLEERDGPLCRVMHAGGDVRSITIAFDGSPTGGGAALWFGLWDCSPKTLDGTPPAEYLAASWGPAEEELLQAEMGKPDGQAHWEAYSILLAVRA